MEKLYFLIHKRQSSSKLVLGRQIQTLNGFNFTIYIQYNKENSSELKDHIRSFYTNDRETAEA